MDWSEAKQWLETLGVTASIGETEWKKMDETTRIIFMADAAAASGKKVEFRVGTPCGHDMAEARNTGTPNWQNRWTCGECGQNFSR